MKLGNWEGPHKWNSIEPSLSKSALMLIEIFFRLCLFILFVFIVLFCFWFGKIFVFVFVFVLFLILFAVITVFTVFRLLTDFVCLYTYEF